MSRPKQRLFNVTRHLLLGVTGVALTVLLWVISRQPGNTAVLSDGTVVRLEKVTFGRLHTGPWRAWPRVKGIITGKRWVPRQKCDTPRDAWVLWFNPSRPNVSPGTNHYFSLFCAKHLGVRLTRRSAGAAVAYCFHQTDMKVIVKEHLRAADGTQTITNMGTWTVRSPKPQPAWIPAEFPQTQSIAGLHLALRDIRLAPDQGSPVFDANGLRRYTSSWRIQVFDVDGFTRGLSGRILAANLQDQSGVLLQGRVRMTNSLTTPLEFSEYGLNRDDPAWKLALHVVVHPLETNVMEFVFKPPTETLKRIGM